MRRQQNGGGRFYEFICLLAKVPQHGASLSSSRMSGDILLPYYLSSNTSHYFALPFESLEMPTPCLGWQSWGGSSHCWFG
jgi:hypothetical protein